MYSVEADRDQRIFVATASGHVTAAEVAAASQQLETLLRAATPGFAVLADYRAILTMKVETARHIGRIMDQLAQKGVGLVVRVMPDPSKDIGMDILSHFHYRGAVEAATVTTMADAIALLHDAG